MGEEDGAGIPTLAVATVGLSNRIAAGRTPVSGWTHGTINTIVGSGSLITFPTLIALGYPPLLANVSNNIGLVPGSLSGAYGYRRELSGQSTRLRRLLPASAIGA